MQRIVLILFLMWQLSGTGVQAQTIWYVSPDGTGGGGSWPAASSLANAIANASSGDELRLLEGIYGITTTLSVTQALIINGGYTGVGTNRDIDANPSVLDGGGTTQIMAIDIAGVEIDGITFLDGFAATGAHVNDGSGGGAIYVSANDVTITNCVFSNNGSAHRIGSGAIYLWLCNNILITDCLFENNRVDENLSQTGSNMGGGAIHVRFGNNTRIVNTIFKNNDSRYTGGAVHDLGEETRFENCIFEDNESGESGGGVYTGRDFTFVQNCKFEGNHAVNGGGLATNFAGFEIIASSFERNSSQEKGGAIYNTRFAEPSVISRAQFHENSAEQGGAIYNYSEEGLKIISSLFVGNQAADKGGAIFNNQFIEIANTTFVRNANTALIMPGAAQSEYYHYETNIFNSIFYLNTAKAGGYRADIHSQDLNMDLSTQDVRRNILQEYTGTTNQVGVDPLFVNNTDDFRLQTASPAVDGGLVALFNGVSDVNAGATTDLGGNPRNQGANIDIGAYEIDPATITLPECVTITAPENGDEDVTLNAAIAWLAAEGATGYRIYIGTSSGSTNVVNGEEVTETMFTPTAGWEENTTYYVTVVPYNAAGEAEGCAEISFTTETLLTTPECTIITAPVNGVDDVALDASVTWETVAGADGYRIYIGTSSGDTDVVNGEEVTETMFTPTAGWEENTTYYVTVVPYNAAGEAEGCAEISFTTETLLTAPECTIITDPEDEATGVGLNAAITWAPADGADGYRVFIGKTFGGTDVVNGEEVTETMFTPTAGWEENTTYYVTVVPYNAAGEAESCAEISFTTETLLTAPECTVITAPANGADDVALDAAITWEAADGADGYRVFIGTASGGTDVVNGEGVTGTAFTPTAGWEENTAYYVTVVPYNAAGEATACPEISFTTETLLTVPECTTVTDPEDEATGVGLNATITWAPAAGADGYRIYIGTSYGGTDVVDGESVIGTSYTPASDWEEGTTYYVTVVPFNTVGEADGCEETSFTTETLLTTPECTIITAPANGVDDVALDASVTWETVAGADGYRIYIGTSSGDTDVVNGEEVTETMFTPTAGWEENTTYYVTVVPYNAAGEATACPEISFTTETLLTVPECTTVTDPEDEATGVGLNAAITWAPAAGADGYRIYIGTSSGGTNVVNGEEVTGTTFTPTAGWEENTTYYVTVVPYNAAGEAESCAEISFATETLLAVPGCTTIISPADGASSASLDAGIVWTAVAGADGYRVSIGTTPGGTDVVSNEEVTGTTFNPGVVFAENTRYYLTVTPFNAAGEASGCGQTWFVIIPDENENINRTKYGISPNGDGINDVWNIDGIENYPDNTVSIFNRWGDMVFQLQQYDNQSKVFNGVANRLTRLGGGVLPSGTYFFTIQYRDGQQLKKVEGFLVLKR